MNEHEKAARYADLHEQRLLLLGEIDAAQCELVRVQDEMIEIWKDGRCARVRETPAQIWAKIQEASK